MVLTCIANVNKNKEQTIEKSRQYENSLIKCCQIALGNENNFAYINHCSKEK